MTLPSHNSNLFLQYIFFTFNDDVLNDDVLNDDVLFTDRSGKLNDNSIISNGLKARYSLSNIIDSSFSNFNGFIYILLFLIVLDTLFASSEHSN